ncbi:MAG TPA: hypothetical protein VGH01_08155 [Jatrophihabitantaceae bacterium]
MTDQAGGEPQHPDDTSEPLAEAPPVYSDPTSPLPVQPAYAPPQYQPPPAYQPPAYPPHGPAPTAPLPSVDAPEAYPGANPSYAPPPPYAPPVLPPPPPPPMGASPAGTGGTGGGFWRSGRNRALTLGVVSAAVIIAVVAVLAASGGSSGASTPREAVQRLLDAGKTNNVHKAEAVLCSSDRALGEVSHLQSSGTITSYSIGDQSTDNGVTMVSATFTTSKNPTPATEQFPVVKEGSWKVCFTKAINALPNEPSSIPSGFPTGALPSALAPRPATSGPIPSGAATIPSVPGVGPVTVPGIASLCQGAASGYGVATTYVGAAEIGVPVVAQACVWHNAVAASVTRSLGGKLFAPQTTDENASVITFHSTDGDTTVTVTTAKEPDGHYYVTGVTVGH